jgi:hypothetical protein
MVKAVMRVLYTDKGNNLLESTPMQSINLSGEPNLAGAVLIFSTVISLLGSILYFLFIILKPTVE